MPSWCSGRSDTIRRSGVPGPATTPPQAGAVTAPLAARAASRAGAPPPPAASVTQTVAPSAASARGALPIADDGDDAVGPRVDPRHRAARGVRDPDAPPATATPRAPGPTSIDRVASRVTRHSSPSWGAVTQSAPAPAARPSSSVATTGTRRRHGAPRDPRELGAAAAARRRPTRRRRPRRRRRRLDVGHDRRCAGRRADRSAAGGRRRRSPTARRGSSARRLSGNHPYASPGGRSIAPRTRARLRCEPEHLPWHGLVARPRSAAPARHHPHAAALRRHVECDVGHAERPRGRGRRGRRA